VRQKRTFWQKISDFVLGEPPPTQVRVYTAKKKPKKKK